ncbi:thioredoxin domain-containing protein 17-like [Lucilia sericata]|uniref:thioredoxin domain-containing protein 17-like n=1 Tax=Lucilia sericata TaxID=13632 RepID=UPI0018A8603A|nr:thioredoxin domain-containing protein 17-like [Lucilia sericata]
MVRKEYTKGFEGYQKSVEELYKDKNTQLYIYFTGEKDSNGVSWCPDCNDAQPFVDQAVEKFATPESILLTVDVGDRPFWKDMKNPFRHDSNIKLMVIPTLVRWKSVLRLEGDQLTKMDLLDMFFNEE